MIVISEALLTNGHSTGQHGVLYVVNVELALLVGEGGHGEGGDHGGDDGGVGVHHGALLRQSCVRLILIKLQHPKTISNKTKYFRLRQYDDKLIDWQINDCELTHCLEIFARKVNKQHFVQDRRTVRQTY